MNDINQLFFSLIRVAIGTQDTLPHAPSAEEWKQLYDMAKKQSLVGICFAALQKLALQRDENEYENDNRIQSKEPGAKLAEDHTLEPCEVMAKYWNMPEMLYLKWMGMAAKIQQRNEIVNKQCVELQSKLATEGIASRILKGQGIAKLYKTTSQQDNESASDNLSLLRQSGDIDIFVDCGREKVVSYVQSVAPTNEVNHKHVQLHYFKDTEVELHYIAAELHCPWHNKYLQQFFALHNETVMMELEGFGEIAVPCGAFNIVHLLTHAYRHIFGDGIGLRQVMDLYFVLHASYEQTYSYSEEKNNSADTEKHIALTEEIKDVVHAAGMDNFASAMMWVLQHVFGLGMIGMPWVPNARDGQFLLNEILMAGNFGKYDARIDRNGETRWHRFWRVTKQNWRLLRFSPWEVICTPLWRIWHFCWMRVHGYTQG